MQVQGEIEGYEARGAQVIAIGQGTGDEAAHYCGKAGAEFDCLGDPEKEAYQLNGLERGSWWSVMLKDMIVHPVESVSLIAQADLKAAQLPASDPLQLGGVAIVDREGVVQYRHIARRPDDVPSNQEIFDALDRMAAA